MTEGHDGEETLDSVIDDETKQNMLDAAHNAYTERVAEYVADQLEILRTVDPDAFARVDVDEFRKEVDRRWRSGELGDWPIAP